MARMQNPDRVKGKHMPKDLRITVWNEGRHEKLHEAVQKVYPEGMGRQVAKAFENKPRIASVRVVELDDPDQGLSDEVLESTDVMTWWGHMAHDVLSDANAERVQQRVLNGMGLIVLHSGHYSKPFKRLMGTNCDLKWREWKGVGEKERLWVVDPAHPVADALPEYFELPNTEMYGEHFNIPQPDSLVFISWFQGGEVFRSGCCWHRGLGKVFYFRPGHETFPIYHDENVQHVLRNAAHWAAPTRIATGPTRKCVEPMENM